MSLAKDIASHLLKIEAGLFETRRTFYLGIWDQVPYLYR